MTWELKPSEYHRASLALKIVGNNKRLKINLATTLGTKNVRDYVEAVVDKSEGMFLYAVYICEDLGKETLSLEQPVKDFREHLPASQDFTRGGLKIWDSGRRGVRRGDGMMRR